MRFFVDLCGGRRHYKVSSDNDVVMVTTVVMTVVMKKTKMVMKKTKMVMKCQRDCREGGGWVWWEVLHGGVLA